MLIGIIDYGCGNIHSIINAFSIYTDKVEIVKKPDQIKIYDKIVLPGVGSFPRGMKMLQENKMIDSLNYFKELERPILGICLGMQLIFEKGFEFSETKGLGFLSGSVEKLQSSKDCKLPNIGWNKIYNDKDDKFLNNKLLNGISSKNEFYFVHSYKCTCKDSEDVVAITNFCSNTFTSVVQKNNIYGVQFHPEKSGKTGLKLISNFISL